MAFIVVFLLQVIATAAKKVLREKSWLEAPEEVVLKVLKIQSMQISEPLLFAQLLKWGRAQAKNEADVRAKIDKGLKLIRFCVMDYAEFSGLCSRPIPLTKAERYKIFLSITQKNSKFLPKGFSSERTPRCSLENVYNFDWRHLKSLHDCTVINSETEPVIVSVAVETDHYLTGVMLYCLTEINAGELVHLTCSVYSSEYPNLCILSASFNDTVSDENEEGVLEFEWPVLLKQGIAYKIKVTYEHEADRLTAVFLTENSFTWTASDPDDIEDSDTTVMFSFDGNSTAPTIDVYGLVMARKLV
jgi:hypothetical protein